MLCLISLVDVLLIVFRKLAQYILSVDEVAQRRFAFECLVWGRLAKENCSARPRDDTLVLNNVDQADQAFNMIRFWEALCCSRDFPRSKYRCIRGSGYDLGACGVGERVRTLKQF
jgi:hypothetical protein